MSREEKINKHDKDIRQKFRGDIKISHGHQDNTSRVSSLNSNSEKSVTRRQSSNPEKVKPWRESTKQRQQLSTGTRTKAFISRSCKFKRRAPDFGGYANRMYYVQQVVTSKADNV